MISGTVLETVRIPSTKPGAFQSLQHDEDIQATQRLRYTIFAEEMGARLHNRIPGLDHDQLDRYCQHLIVRNTLGQVVGYIRILPTISWPG